MTLDRELVKEGCLKLWGMYQKEIENLGYTLSKDSMKISPEEISIVATIKPYYPDEMFKKFRKIIPMEFLYEGENIPVYISPSVEDLFKFSIKV